MAIKDEWARMAEHVDHFEYEEQTTKTVSLRLDAFMLAHIDIVAEEVKMSRQAVLEKMILDSISLVLFGVMEGKTTDDIANRQAYLTKLNDRVIAKGVELCADAGVAVNVKGWALLIYPDFMLQEVAK